MRCIFSSWKASWARFEGLGLTFSSRSSTNRSLRAHLELISVQNTFFRLRNVETTSKLKLFCCLGSAFIYFFVVDSR